jgi:hypothetical protein
VDASASLPADVARRLGLRAGARPRAVAGGARVQGFAAAAPVVVARGHATARGAGVVTVRLTPTPAARRAAARMRGTRLTVRVGQAAASATRTIRVGS